MMDAIVIAVSNRLITVLDPIVLVLIVLLFVCHYTSAIRSKEDREDRNRLISALDANNKVVDQLKNVISAALGKVL